MRTTEEKLRQIHRGCDKVVDELEDNPSLLESHDYDQGRYDLAKEIMDIIEGE